MNEEARAAFNKLKPYCISLSAVTLRNPHHSRKQLLELARALSSTDPSCINQNIANYIFFPLKPLLVKGLPESISLALFEILKWLLQTEWYVRGGDMATQLIRLFSTLLAQANSEELRTVIYQTFRELFYVADTDVNALPSRPTLAFFVTTALEESTSSRVQCEALEALLMVFSKFDGDATASFLPGLISSLSKTLVKHNQKSSFIIVGLDLLREAVLRSMDGSITDYRNKSWRDATNSQLVLALGPILSYLAASEYSTVIDKLSSCCSELLGSTIPGACIVEVLLRIKPEAIPPGHESEIANLLESYIAAMPRILQGVDEDRKIHMLKTFSKALPLLPQHTRHMLSSRVVGQICDFVRFPENVEGVAIIAHEEEAPAQPKVQYLSALTRDALQTLLSHCSSTVIESPTTPELFWIAQSMELDTYSHALRVLPDQPDAALRSIIEKARRTGPEFRAELMHVLYPILALPQPSLYALHQIAQSCHYASTQEMITDNADYIVNSLDLAFVTLDITPRTPRILGLLVQLAPEMIEVIDDVIETFFDVLDDFHQYEGIVDGIFSGLSDVVGVVLKQNPKSSFQAVLETVKIEEEKSFEERFQEVEENVSGSRAIDEESAHKDSKSYEIVLEIMQKAQIFLSHESRLIKIKILELLYSGIPVVAQNENKFLPLVHLIWPQLTRRLEDKDSFVVAAVMRVIARTITFAGSFMRMRINNDVIPAIQEIVHSQKGRRGKTNGARRDWEGTGRRKVAEGLQGVLKAVVEDGGLDEEEQVKVLAFAQELGIRQVIHA